MASFLLDHNVKALVATLPRTGGHAGTTAVEPRLDRSSDGRLLLAAARSGLILVTHNKTDFRLLHQAWLSWAAEWGVARSHAGILILPQPLAAAESAPLLTTFVEQHRALANELHEWRLATGWSRRP